MSRKKLTLSVESSLTKRAKAIARERGTSVSRLVETFFSALDAQQNPEDRNEESSFGTDRTQSSTEEAEKPQSFLEGYEASDWIRRWRGAFAQEETSYPDRLEWEEEILTQEISDKHS